MIYSPLAFDGQFKVEFGEGRLSVSSSKHLFMHAEVSGTRVRVSGHNAGKGLDRLMLVGLEHLFGNDKDLLEIQLDGFNSDAYPFSHFRNRILRAEFFQVPLLWTSKPQTFLAPERWTESQGTSHPERERFPEGTFYRKFVPQIGKTLSLRPITEEDLDTFHHWHNQPRVSHFWELNKSKEELLEYIRKGLKDPHQLPVMVSLDEEKVGYYEFYWVKEDRLGPYYESEAYDRGFHFLIGNEKFLGFRVTDALIKTVLHFLFLDDPRTRRIMAEPRHDNQKVLRYAEAAIGWKKLKEFDFPHKRAALLECRRELFFGGHAL